MTRGGVAITGVGVVSAAVTGDSAALGAFLAAPTAPATETLGAGALAALVDPGEARRLSRVCQITIAAARLALREAGVDLAAGLGLVVGTEFGDLAPRTRSPTASSSAVRAASPRCCSRTR